MTKHLFGSADDSHAIYASSEYQILPDQSYEVSNAKYFTKALLGGECHQQEEAFLVCLATHTEHTLKTCWESLPHAGTSGGIVYP